jgi:starch-binding outer membrane protein, SusD/RagB family
MKLYKILFLVLLTTLMSCEDYLVKYPLDAPSSSTFPKSQDELIIAINGAYNALYYLPSSFMQAELYYEGLSDLNFIRGGSAHIESVVMGNSTPATPLYSSAWNRYYSAIQRSNFILDNMERAREIIDASTCDLVEAQAKFLRAWNYMYLTEFYGDVPLVTISLSLEEAQTPRAPKSQVADLMMQDLDFAAAILPVSYPSADKGRATKGAALALKARIALYNSRFSEAAEAAQQVMELGYKLHDNYGDLFQLAGNLSEETIFQVSYHLDVRKNTNSVIMNARKGSGWSVSVPTQYLVDSYLCTDGESIDKSPLYDPENPFENRDPRLKQSIIVPQTWFAGYLFETHPDSITTIYNGVSVNNLEVTNPFATFTGYLWRKNNDETQFVAPYNGSAMPYKLIRYAEVLLTYAEAKIELNQIDQSALDAINLVRQRAQMPDVEGGLSQDEMRKIIRNERKVELAGEGWRTFDIRRWKIAEHVLNGNLVGRKIKEYWSNPGIPTINEYGHPVYADQDQVFKVIQVRKFNPARDYLWPIPQKEMDINKELVQNPGY